MITSLRLPGLLAAALGCGTAGYTLYPGNEAVDPEAESARAAELEEQRALVAARVKSKRRLTEDLVAGRRSLAEVTDLFMQLNHQPPELVSQMRILFPAATERESTARQVVEHAHVHAETRTDLPPERRERLFADLDAQFRKMFE